MHNRREFLRHATAGAGLTAGVAGLSGCLDVLDDDGGDDNTDPDAGDRFYDGFADPTDTVVPRYYTGYDYDAETLLDAFDASAVFRQAGLDFFANVVPEIDGVTEPDIDRLRGNRYRQIGSAGTEEFDVLGPEGQGLHVTGEFDADPFVEFFESAGIEEFGERDGYRRFGTEQQQAAESFAVDDGSFVFGERVNASDHAPEPMIDAELDGVLDREGAVRTLLPEFVAAADLVEGDTVHAGVQYDLVTLGADSGTEAFDDAVIGLSATSIGVTINEDGVDIERGLVYLTEEYADADAVVAAFDAAADGEGETTEPAVDWGTEQDGRTVHATATVDREEIDAAPGLLHAPVPFPGYDDMFFPVNPSTIGRDPVPRVAISATVEDGRVQLEHADGDTLDTLTVQYVTDGERQSEPWEGPVTVGDTFETAEQVDSNTTLYVVWEPETVNAAVLFRVTTS